jgi:WhiB family redox-sensing transcriptional regulator
MMGRETPRPDTSAIWQDRAECRNYPHLSWFPERGEPQEQQKTICRQLCPVRAECEQAGWENNERLGIWGGVTERARRARRSANYRAQQAQS